MRRLWWATIVVGICAGVCVGQQPATAPSAWRPLEKADPMPMRESLDKDTQIAIEMRLIAVDGDTIFPTVDEEPREAGPHYQIIDEQSLRQLLRATQADRRTTTVTAPRYYIFNRQSTILRLCTQRGFISKNETKAESEEWLTAHSSYFMRAGVWNSGNNDVIHINLGPLWQKPNIMIEPWPETVDAQENVLWRSEALCVLRETKGVQLQSGQTILIYGIKRQPEQGEKADARKMIFMIRCKIGSPQK